MESQTLIARTSKSAYGAIMAAQLAGWRIAVPPHIKAVICAHISAIDQARWLGHGFERHVADFGFTIAIATGRLDDDPSQSEIRVTTVTYDYRLRFASRPPPGCRPRITKKTHIGDVLVASHSYECDKCYNYNDLITAMSTMCQVRYKAALWTRTMLPCAGQPRADRQSGAKYLQPRVKLPRKKDELLWTRIMKSYDCYRLSHYIEERCKRIGIDIEISENYHTQHVHKNSDYSTVIVKADGRYRAIYGRYRCSESGRQRRWAEDGSVQYDYVTRSPLEYEFTAVWNQGKFAYMTRSINPSAYVWYAHENPHAPEKPTLDQLHGVPREYWPMFGHDN